MTASFIGDWPNVDIQLLQDYNEAHAKGTLPVCVLRIHMDVPIDEAAIIALAPLLKAQKFGEVMAYLSTNSHIGNPKKRGKKTLEGALYDGP